jgi:hypothetical protein
MKQPHNGEYPADWPAIAKRVKDEAGWRCLRCDHPHEPAAGYTLTVHHADTDKGNVRWWNLLPLCQRCHLSIQGRVVMDRPWVFEHTDWFKTHVAGFYAHKYLGLELTRSEVIARLDELLALERDAVIGLATAPAMSATGIPYTIALHTEWPNPAPTDLITDGGDA